jgi:hypothetical protein
MTRRKMGGKAGWHACGVMAGLVLADRDITVARRNTPEAEPCQSIK